MLLIGIVTSAHAYDFQSGDLCYNIQSEEDLLVSVTYLEENGNSIYVSGDIEIPQEVTYNSKTYKVVSIGDKAFNGCPLLTSVIIPNSVTSIGNDAFALCNNLTTVTLPNSVRSIGDNAFFYCEKITSITIPNSVITIGNGAFADCHGLTSVTISNSVTSIGKNAFRSSALTSVTIPNSVTSIGENAFIYCGSLENINVESENANYSSIDGVLYNKDVTTLICCPGTKASVTIPNSVNYIGVSAFAGCHELTSITIPNSVTSIGEYAFSNSALTSVTIPNSVTSIGDGAFYFCYNVLSVTIPNSVTSIGDNAFLFCSMIKSIYMQCEVPVECNPMFHDQVLQDAVLYVPSGTIEAYKQVVPWKNFKNIEEMNFSSVDKIEDNNNGSLHIAVNNRTLTIDGIGAQESITLYDMQGRIVYNGTSHTVEGMTPGMYIVKAGSRTIKISI